MAVGGCALPTDTPRLDGLEVVAPFAFDLPPGGVPLTLDHDPHRRIAEGATVWQDRRGVWFRAEIPDTPTGRDVVAMLPLAASVSFTITQAETIGGVRHIRRARLHEIALTRTPAYPNTEITKCSET